MAKQFNAFDLLTEDRDPMKYKIDEDGNYVFESNDYKDLYKISIAVKAKGCLMKYPDSDVWYLKCRSDLQKSKAEQLFYKK